MECQQYRLSSHAIKRLFERGIQKNEAISVIQNGEIITEYPKDKPYSSSFFINDRPLHVLFSLDIENKICYIITVYELNPKIWSSDFKTRIIK